MRRSTFSILFYLNRSKIKKNGCCPIMGRITVDGGIANFSTGREVSSLEWDSEKGAVSNKAVEARKINRSLDMTREQLQQHYNLLVERDGYITAELLKNELTGSASGNTGLLSEALAMRDEIFKGINVTHAYSTCCGYQNSCKNLCDFVNDHLGMEDIAFTALDNSFIENYDFFLKIHKKHKESTVNKHMIFLHKVLTLAVRKKLIRRDLFEGYRYAKSPTRRKWLNQHELQAIMAVPASGDKANLVRHLFIFAAFTGLSKAELLYLKDSDVYTNASGGKEIRVRRVKTGTECIVPLSGIPLQIIRLYEGKRSGGRLFPKTNKKEIGYQIKYIAGKAGLAYLTFHMARHTFSTMCLSKGMGIETLSRILGHVSIRTTQIYAKITDRKIAEDMKNVALSLENEAGDYATNDVVKPVRERSECEGRSFHSR